MKHPLAAATDLKEPSKLLGAYRLIPVREISPGNIVWANATTALATSTAESPVLPPEGTTTAGLSVVDYRIVTAELALREEQSCQ